MAILEKVTSRLGALGFVWGTVVLLGSFVNTLKMKDFVFVSMTLLLEGIRIFCHNHELELRHQATWSLNDARQPSANNSRIANNSSGSRRSVWHSHNMQQLELPIHFISRLFYWFQLVSAMACATLSMMRLAAHDFRQREEADKTNQDLALIIFYVMALAEALVFLAKKAFWKWKVSYCRLLEKVIAECLLDPSDMDSIKRFFYDAYSKCMTGSIFDGLKMDLVTYAVEELLVASSHREQLLGARILRAFSTHRHLSDAALHKIGTSMFVIEQLILMLNWNEPTDSQEEIRYSAAVIVSELADKDQNALRLAGIPGAIESISSLLYSSSMTQGHKYNSLDFNLMGLSILMKLAKEPGNCKKICNTHNLLEQLIGFTDICHTNPKAVESSLQVVKMLSGTMGKTGLVFRWKISEVASTTKYIKNILHHGGRNLQRLDLQVLTNLAMDAEARERIGRTGGMVDELFGLFFLPERTDDQNMLRKEAGEALAMLILESKVNCSIILKHKRTLERLITEALEDPVLSVISSRIQLNLCAFAGPECYQQLGKVVASLNPVFNAIMEDKGRVELLEVSLGLAAQMVKFMKPHKLTEELRRACHSDDDLINRLVGILAAFREPSIEAPQIRRFSIELTVEMMTINKECVKLFKDAGIAGELSHIAETISELECLNVFSGSVGLSKHEVSLQSLLDKASKLVADVIIYISIPLHCTTSAHKLYANTGVSKISLSDPPPDRYSTAK